MYVELKNIQPERVETIIAAVSHLWNWENTDVYSNQTCIELRGKDFLYGGTSEEEFAEHLSKLIWDANEKFCEINVNCTYLEDLPYESYHQGIEEYTRFKQKKAS